MAFLPTELLLADPVARLWTYRSTDTPATVIGGTYLPDGLGLRVGDTILIRQFTTGAFTALTTQALHSVTAVAATGVTALGMGGAAVPGGSDGQVQFASSGAFAGIANSAVTPSTGVVQLAGLTIKPADTTGSVLIFKHLTDNMTGAAVDFGWSHTSNVVVNGRPGGGNYTDDVWAAGINAQAHEVRFDATQPYLAIAFESNFCQTPGVAPLGSEFQITHIGTFDSNVRRFFGAFLPSDQLAGSILSYRIDNISWLGWSTGNQLMKWEYTPATPVINVYHTVRSIYNFGANNVAWGKQINAALGAYLDLPYYDAGNVLKVPAAAYLVGGKPAAGATFTNSFLTLQPTGSWASGDVGLALYGPTVSGSYIAQEMTGDATTGVSVNLYNNRAAAGAHATYYARTINGSGGDPAILLEINGIRQIMLGIDNSDSDAFVISEYNVLGVNNVVRIAAGGSINVCASKATPAGGHADGSLIFGTTAGFGIYYGSGAPTVSAGKGSVYLRTDGSSTSTRFYVNTDGATTWTSANTAA